MSLCNTKLRDECSGLEALCDALDADLSELTGRLAAAGYAYDPNTNQFRP